MFSKRKIDYFIFFLIILGALNSLLITIHNIAIESDTADTITLWSGFQQYGWEFLKSYRYTIDSWIFSLVPIHFLLFYIFGPSPHIVIVGGWVIYIFILIFLNLCAKEAGVNLRARLLSIMFLSYANVGTLWYCGYLTYSISHNISILFFIISYYIVLKSKSNLSLLSYFLLNLLAAISDPWLSFAFILPAFVSCFITFCVRKERYFYKISIISLLIFIINVISVKSNVFGLLPFIVGAQPTELNLEIISSKIHFITRTFGFFFQFLPEKLIAKESQDGLILGFWLVIFIYSVLNFIRNLKLKSSKEISTFFMIVLSVLSLLSAQVLFAEVTQDFSGRYIITIFLLTPFIISMGLKDRISVDLKFFYFLFMFFYLFTTISTSHHFWKKDGYVSDRTDDVSKLLRSENLTFGYGLYWDSEAPAVSWINNGTLIVRSVLFNNDRKMLTRDVGWQTNALWYDKKDIVNQPNRQFLILKNKGYADPCGDDKVQGCGKELTSQFGKPEKVVRNSEYTLFIWNKPLSDNFID